MSNLAISAGPAVAITDSLAKQQRLLDEWHVGIRILHIAHKNASARYRNHYRTMGLCVTILSTAVSASLFTMASRSAIPWLSTATGCVSLLAAVTSASHSFLRHAERSEQHREASTGYGDLRRQIELDRTIPATLEQMTAMMQLVRERWHELDERSPEIPPPLHNAAIFIVTGRRMTMPSQRSPGLPAHAQSEQGPGG